MSITQSAAQLQPIAAKVGIPKERATSIKTLGDAASVEDAADLTPVLNSIGYYDEKAAHLVAAGMTFEPEE